MERANIALLDSCKAPADLGVGMNMAALVEESLKILKFCQHCNVSGCFRMFEELRCPLPLPSFGAAPNAFFFLSNS